MAERYTKLAAAIVYSSMWDEPGDVCKIWITLLALRDYRTGVVQANVTGIARLCNLPVEVVEAALEKFAAPDMKSSNSEHDGRRVERVSTGWRLLNHERYLELGWNEGKREYERRRKADYRARKGEEADETVPCGTKPPVADYTEAKAALATLNDASGRAYRETETNIGLINARLNEPGVTLLGVQTMVRRQCEMWKGDPKMCEFLRPATLFGKEKFDSYYGAKDQQVVPLGGDMKPKPATIQEKLDKEVEVRTQQFFKKYGHFERDQL